MAPSLLFEGNVNPLSFRFLSILLCLLMCSAVSGIEERKGGADNISTKTHTPLSSLLRSLTLGSHSLTSSGRREGEGEGRKERMGREEREMEVREERREGRRRVYGWVQELVSLFMIVAKAPIQNQLASPFSLTHTHTHTHSHIYFFLHQGHLWTHFVCSLPIGKARAQTMTTLTMMKRLLSHARRRGHTHIHTFLYMHTHTHLPYIPKAISRIMFLFPFDPCVTLSMMRSRRLYGMPSFRLMSRFSDQWISRGESIGFSEERSLNTSMSRTLRKDSLWMKMSMDVLEIRWCNGMWSTLAW